MDIPFDIEKHEMDRLYHEISRFFELYRKYEDDVNEILEFAELWRKYAPNIQNKYEDV